MATSSPWSPSDMDKSAFAAPGPDAAYLSEEDFIAALFTSQDVDIMTRCRNLPSVDRHVAASDSPDKSHPGDGSGVASLSLSSPGTASLVYTPESTLGLHNDLTFDSEEWRNDDALFQPSPSASSYVHLDRFGSESGGDQRSMDNNRPPPSSGVSSFASLSHSPSPSPATSVHHQRQSWPSFTSTSAAGGWMDAHHDGHYGPLDTAMAYTYTTATLSTTAAATAYHSEFSADVGHQDVSNTSLPFRAMGMNDRAPAFSVGHYLDDDPFAMQPTLLSSSEGMHQQRQAQAPSQGFPSSDRAYRLVHDPLVYTALVEPHHSTMAPELPTTEAIRLSLPSDQPSHRPGLGSSTLDSRHHHSLPNDKHVRSGVDGRRHHSPPSDGHARSRVIVTPVRPLQPAIPSRPSLGSTSLADHAMARRGGRRKKSHLPDNIRERSHKMRKTGACWGCALQRDPCPDEGTPCQRCISKAQKGHIYYFACERSKLPDLVLDFLPPSMTLMHQKQSIEDCVTDKVLRWENKNAIKIRLTSGYGPPLEWHVYEFVPKTIELLGQYQYRQDEQGVTRRLTKYSPPLGLLQIDTSDSVRAEEYLDRILQSDYLDDFGWTCFEEESQVDYFQASMLQAMCDLYLDTDDLDLQALLQKIIRMMAITYIMGHTLTIEEDDFFSIISQIRHSYTPHERQIFTSPRLANRQLKFFFSILRGNIYDNILNWQQQTLHASGKKEATWLPAFCVMLGFAMVLEEVQRTIILQADAKISLNEMTPEHANAEAENACRRIDERFAFLVGLFQCKYRDRKWTRGSFGNGTPELKDPHARKFLTKLHKMVTDAYPHLQARRDVQFKPEHQCLYTSRLVARFLLPFLGLPP